jgi:hypothetical protein
MRNFLKILIIFLALPFSVSAITIDKSSLYNSDFHLIVSDAPEGCVISFFPPNNTEGGCFGWECLNFPLPQDIADIYGERIWSEWFVQQGCTGDVFGTWEVKDLTSEESTFFDVLPDPTAPVPWFFGFSSPALAYIGEYWQSLSAPIAIIFGWFLTMWIADFVFDLVEKRRKNK